MKKMIVLLTALAVLGSFTACGSKAPAADGGNTSQSAMEALPEDATPAQIVVADFTDKVNEGSYDSLETLAEAMMSGDHIEFAPAWMPVEEGYLNGFSDEVTGFDEAVMFGPAIGSIPFIGYVFDVKDDVKPEDFIAEIEGLADLRWNICTQADEMLSGNVGDKVCFVMSPLTFEE